MNASNGIANYTLCHSHDIHLRHHHHFSHQSRPHPSLCRPRLWAGPGSPLELDTVYDIENNKNSADIKDQSMTIHSMFGFEADLVITRRQRDAGHSFDIGKFVFGDIPRIENPTGVVQTLGGTPDASFAFANNIIGPDERSAIRNVVDAAYLRYVTQEVPQGVRHDS